MWYAKRNGLSQISAHFSRKMTRHLHATYNRLVSLTCVPCKMLEHIVCSNIMAHLDEHTLGLYRAGNMLLGKHIVVKLSWLQFIWIILLKFWTIKDRWIIHIGFWKGLHSIHLSMYPVLYNIACLQFNCIYYYLSPIVSTIISPQLYLLLSLPNCIYYYLSPIVFTIISPQLYLLFSLPNCIYYYLSPIVFTIFSPQLYLLLSLPNCIYYYLSPIVFTIISPQLYLLIPLPNCIYYYLSPIVFTIISPQ